MKKLILMTIMVALMAAPVLANPSFGDGGAALQGVLDGIADDGTNDVKAATDALSDTLDSYWAIDASGGSVTTMVIELASWSNTNVFGVYDQGSATYVQLFDGSAVAGDQVTLSIDASGNVFKNHADTGIDFTGTTFGYYIDSTRAPSPWVGGVWHSDTLLNSDQQDHMAAYQGIGEDVTIAPWPSGPWNDNLYVLAFEDLDLQHWGNGNGINDGYPEWSDAEPDFTDLVVMVESVNPTIPAPGAMILGSIGVSFVGWLRRRRSL